MKTSNKLLTALLILVFLGIICTSMILKAEYEKIGSDNIFYGYSQEPIQSFKAIRLEGHFPGLVQIQQADSFVLRINQQKREYISWTINNDTLIFSYQPQEHDRNIPMQNILRSVPDVYIMAPAISKVLTQHMSCKLTGWQLNELSLEQLGKHSGMLFTESTVDNLSANITQGATLHLDDQVQVKQASIIAKDSSTFIADQQHMEALNIDADATASLKLKGALFKQLVPGEQ